MAQSIEHMAVLDGLRGLAIALVVVFHVWQLSWFDFRALAGSPPFSIWFLHAHGWIGVEIFFFISGFCIFWPYARARHGGKPAPTLREFFQRRARKILPSYWLAVGLTLWLVPGAWPSERPWLHLLTHLFFVQTFTFATFDTISGVLWSLAIEVQFYVVFALALPLLRRNPLLMVLALCVVATAYRAALSLHHEENGVNFSHQLNQLPGVADLFATGILAAELLCRWRPLVARWHRAAWTIAGVVSFVGLVAVLRTLEPAGFVPGGILDWQTRYRLGLGLVLLLVTVTGGLSARWWQVVLANPLARFLAAISYNLYLWHKVIADELLRRQIPRFVGTDPHQDPRWQSTYTLLVLVASILVATVLTVTIERPFVARRRKRVSGPSKPSPETSKTLC